MTQASRAYVREFGTAMVAYVIVLLASIRLIQTVDLGALKFVVALLPMIPIAFALVAYMRFLRRMDELQVRVQLEAIAFAAAAVGLLTFAYGFLENVGLPPLPMIWVFPLLVACWGIGGAIAARHYR